MYWFSHSIEINCLVHLKLSQDISINLIGQPDSPIFIPVGSTSPFLSQDQVYQKKYWSSKKDTYRNQATIIELSYWLVNLGKSPKQNNSKFRKSVQIPKSSYNSVNHSRL